MAAIFVNYRIADTLQVADRLAVELRRKFGENEVFFDRRSIEGGDAWDDGIEAAVGEATVVLVLIGQKWLTEQNEFGIRRLDVPGDWVRREIEAAISGEATLIPLMVDGGLVPPEAAFMNLPDLRSLSSHQAMPLRTSAWDSDFSSLIDRLTSIGLQDIIRRKSIVRRAMDPERPDDIVSQIGLGSAPPAFRRRVRRFIRSYLGTDSVSVPFGGREREITRLNDWVTDPEGPSRLLLTAEAGRGKTALVVRWIDQLSIDIPVIFVPISIRFETSQPIVFYQALATRLADILDEELAATGADAVEFYKEKIIEFFDIIEETHERCLVVIDGLDEATGWHFNANVLPDFRIPSLRVLVSARILAGDVGDTGWMRRLGWENAGDDVEGVYVSPLDAPAIGDVLIKSSGNLAELSREQSVLVELERLTEGDPLLLTYYVEDLIAHRDQSVTDTTARLRARAQGFGSYFENWLALQGGVASAADDRIDEQTIKAILAVMASAHGPLMLRDLVHLSRKIHGVSQIIAADTMKSIGRFIVGDGTEIGYALGHPKLREYLRRDYFGESDVVVRTDLGFVEWGRRTIAAVEDGDLPAAEVSAYLLKFYVQHLISEAAPTKDFDQLTSSAWRDAWNASPDGDGFRGLRTDVETALEELIERIDDGRSVATNETVLTALRCVLVICRIDGLGLNIPVKLIALALARRRLAFAQALQFLQRPTRLETIEATIEIVPHVDPQRRQSLLEDLFNSARSISLEKDRAGAFAAFSKVMGEEFQHDVLASIGEISNEAARVLALTAFLRNCDGSIAKEVVRQILNIRSPETLGWAIDDIVGIVPEDTLDALLTATQHLKHAHWRFTNLMTLAHCYEGDARQAIFADAVEATALLDGQHGYTALRELSTFVSKSARLSELINDAVATLGFRNDRRAIIGACRLLPTLSREQIISCIRNTIDAFVDFWTPDEFAPSDSFYWSYSDTPSELLSEFERLVAGPLREACMLHRVETEPVKQAVADVVEDCVAIRRNAAWDEIDFDAAKFVDIIKNAFDQPIDTSQDDYLVKEVRSWSDNPRAPGENDDPAVGEQSAALPAASSAEELLAEISQKSVAECIGRYPPGSLDPLIDEAIMLALRSTPSSGLIKALTKAAPFMSSASVAASFEMAMEVKGAMEDRWRRTDHLPLISALAPNLDSKDAKRALAVSEGLESDPGWWVISTTVLEQSMRILARLRPALDPPDWKNRFQHLVKKMLNEERRWKLSDHYVNAIREATDQSMSLIVLAIAKEAGHQRWSYILHEIADKLTEVDRKAAYAELLPMLGSREWDNLSEEWFRFVSNMPVSFGETVFASLLESKLPERTRNMILGSLTLRCSELRDKLTTAIGAPRTSEALRRAATFSGNWWHREKNFTGSSALDQALVGYDRNSGVGDDYVPMIQSLDAPELSGLIEEVLGLRDVETRFSHALPLLDLDIAHDLRKNVVATVVADLLRLAGTRQLQLVAEGLDRLPDAELRSIAAWSIEDIDDGSLDFTVLETMPAGRLKVCKRTTGLGSLTRVTAARDRLEVLSQHEALQIDDADEVALVFRDIDPAPRGLIQVAFLATAGKPDDDNSRRLSTMINAAASISKISPEQVETPVLALQTRPPTEPHTATSAAELLQSEASLFLQNARSLAAQDDLGWMVTALAPFLSVAELKHAMAIARELLDPEDRIRTTLKVAEIQPEKDRAESLREMLPEAARLRLPERLLESLIDVAPVELMAVFASQISQIDDALRPSVLSRIIARAEPSQFDALRAVLPQINPLTKRMTCFEELTLRSADIDAPEMAFRRVVLMSGALPDQVFEATSQTLLDHAGTNGEKNIRPVVDSLVEISSWWR